MLTSDKLFRRVTGQTPVRTFGQVLPPESNHKGDKHVGADADMRGPWATIPPNSVITFLDPGWKFRPPEEGEAVYCDGDVYGFDGKDWQLVLQGVGTRP